MLNGLVNSELVVVLTGMDIHVDYILRREMHNFRLCQPGHLVVVSKSLLLWLFFGILKKSFLLLFAGVSTMDHQQYQYQEDPSTCANYPLYGHSLSWEDMTKPKYGPNNTLCAKIWTPAVETCIDTDCSSSYPDTDFSSLWRRFNVSSYA